AINDYVKSRQRVSGRNGANASGRLARHVLSDKQFADTLLTKLRSSHFDAWRSRLPIIDEQHAEPEPKGDSSDVTFISPATVNRLMNDLRAALNAAVEKHRRELPAALPLE